MSTETEDRGAYPALCVYCRNAIRRESIGSYMGSDLGVRWVHESSGIPRCAETIATPVIASGEYPAVGDKT